MGYLNDAQHKIVSDAVADAELVTSGEIDLALLYDQDGIGDCPSRLILMEDLWFYAAPDDWPFATPPGVPVPLAEVMALDLGAPPPPAPHTEPEQPADIDDGAKDFFEEVISDKD